MSTFSDARVVSDQPGRRHIRILFDALFTVISTVIRYRRQGARAAGLRNFRRGACAECEGCPTLRSNTSKVVCTTTRGRDNDVRALEFGVKLIDLTGLRYKHRYYNNGFLCSGN